MSSMKEELEIWVTALAHYDRNEFEEAIRVFQPIADTSKIYFNCGVIRATLGEHADAVQYYHKAMELDQYLAIAYFQAGVSNFLTGDFEEALANFNDTLLYLRGNTHIDYEQLGLKFKLYSCEALFNRGLCYVYLQMRDTGIADMKSASKEKAVADHDVIDEAITEKAEGYTVFSIPVGVVFRPSDAKVKNVRARDYLGRQQVRLVADGSTQAAHRRNVSAETWARDDRPAEQLSYAATHLVKPNLVSRSRQQSEPPINRNMFPPTPPPESEKPHFFAASAQAQEPSSNSNRAKRSNSASRAPKPERLELGVAAFEKPPTDAAGSVRRGTARSASERPAERRRERPDREERDRDRRQLFGSVEGGDRAEDVGTRLQQTASGPSPTFSSSSRGSQSGRTRRAPPSTSDRLDKHSSSGGRNQQLPTLSMQDIGEEEEPEVVDDGPRVVRSPASATSSTAYGRIPIANDTPHGLRSPMTVGRLKSLRVKVHYGDDTRYVIVAPAATFEEFVDMVARKFAVRAAQLKMRTKDDEGDLITMGDQEDFSLAVSLCEATARKDGADVGKMEIWAQAIAA